MQFKFFVFVLILIELIDFTSLQHILTFFFCYYKYNNMIIIIIIRLNDVALLCMYNSRNKMK